MREQALQKLRDIFGYGEFRGQQADIIDQVACGGDALVLMPTGGGKSLCYQIPGLLRPGLTGGLAPVAGVGGVRGGPPRGGGGGGGGAHPARGGGGGGDCPGARAGG